MTQYNDKLNTIIKDIAVMKPQLDGIEKRLDGIDNRLWLFIWCTFNRHISRTFETDS
jgi:hypothetical protein